MVNLQRTKIVIAMLRKKIAVIILLTFESIILVLLIKPSFRIQETAKIVDGKKTFSRKLCVLESVA